MDRHYTITLDNETVSKKDSSNIAGQQTQPQPKTVSNRQKNISPDISSYVSFKNVVKPFVRQQIQHYVNTVQLRTGSQELQQKISFAYELGSQVIGIAENIALGAIKGGVPGAVIGTVIGVSSSIMNLVNKQDTINMKTTLENISLGYADKRAGGGIASVSGSRNA